MFQLSHSSCEASRGPRSLRTSQGLAESIGFKTAHTAVYNRQKSMLFVAFFPLQLPLRKYTHTHTHAYVFLQFFYKEAPRL